MRTLERLLLTSEPYIRPSEPNHLAPLDQASQHPIFPAASDCGSPEEFASAALLRPHPAAAPAPALPHDLERAVVYTWSLGSACQPERRRRLRIFEGVSTSLRMFSCELDALLSPSARAIARAMALDLRRRIEPQLSIADIHEDESHGVHLALLAAILDALAWPDISLLKCLVRGFPIVGMIPDSHVWRPLERPASKPFPEFAATNAAWVLACRQRVLAAARRDPEMAQACWARTVEESHSGLIHGPFHINDLNQRPGTWEYAFGFGKWRPMPRFAISQKDKWRCIDDAAASGHNDDGMCTVETICCDRPDSPLRIGLRFHELGPPPDDAAAATPQLGGGTDDMFAAYRRIPSLQPAYAVVMVARPSPAPSGDWECTVWCVPGHNFGLASAVLNWNRLPAPLCAFSRRFFGVPVTFYYDDEQVTEPSFALGSGQEVHVLFHEELGLHFSADKHKPWSASMVYCGVQTDWRHAVSRGVVTVGPTDSRREKAAGIIDDILRRGSLSTAEASSLYGKLRFCLCPIFGRVGLAALAVLKLRQHGEIGASCAEGPLCDGLEALRLVVRLLPSFSAPVRADPRPPIIVFSDASWEPGHSWLGLVVFHPDHGCFWAGMETPEWLLSVFARHRARHTYIGQLEAVAALAVYLTFPASFFHGRLVTHYVDNQGALYSFVKGRCADADINRVVFLAGLVCQRLHCRVWYDYVPSKANVADLPTRLCPEALLRLQRLGQRVVMTLPPASFLRCFWRDLLPLFASNL